MIKKLDVLQYNIHLTLKKKLSQVPSWGMQGST